MPPSSPFSSYSAYGATLSSLRALVRDLEIDHQALWRHLQPCDLGRCRGTCCHDGVYLDPDEAPVLEALVDQARSEIESTGVSLPESPIVSGSWRGTVSGPKTATRPEPMAERAEAYPAHFPDTACVFLLPDARCALQQLAVDRGLDPWYYKPATCWLHPLSIEAPLRPGGPSRLTLHTPQSDPQRLPDYDGFTSRTPCGTIRTDSGRPAWQVLRAELDRLGRIGGRDLIGEIEAAQDTGED